VKNATQCAKNLTSLLKKLPAVEPPELPVADDPVVVLIQSFLMWEADSTRAGQAFDRIQQRVADYNDLRVSMPHEIADYIGSRYPMAEERARRLRATLRNVYLREHDVTLTSLSGLGKREVRKYVESLEGIVPYVANRLLLLCFDVHAVPVDSVLQAKLIEAGAADKNVDVSELAAWLSRQIKAADGLKMHATLQAWVEKSEKKPRTTTKKAPTKRKTTGAKKTKAPTTRRTSKAKS